MQRRNTVWWHCYSEREGGRERERERSFSDKDKEAQVYINDGSITRSGKSWCIWYILSCDWLQSIGLLISLAVGNGWDMRHWDISVAFTNALSQEPTYLWFPINMPDDLISGFKGGNYALLCRNLNGSKTAPKLWYLCLIECLSAWPGQVSTWL